MGVLGLINIKGCECSTEYTIKLTFALILMPICETMIVIILYMCKHTYDNERV